MKFNMKKSDIALYFCLAVIIGGLGWMQWSVFSDNNRISALRSNFHTANEQVITDLKDANGRDFDVSFDMPYFAKLTDDEIKAIDASQKLNKEWDFHNENINLYNRFLPLTSYLYHKQSNRDDTIFILEELAKHI